MTQERTGTVRADDLPETMLIPQRVFTFPILRRLCAALVIAAGLVSAREGIADDPVSPRAHVAVGPLRVELAASASRPCGPVDLLGTWELVSYGHHGAPRQTTAPYLRAYQVFQFGKDGVFKSLHAQQAPIGDPEELLAGVPPILRYEMFSDHRGIVRVRRGDERTAAETWQCRRVTIDQVDLVQRRILQRGDMVLTLVGKSGAPLFTRQLRRL